MLFLIWLKGPGAKKFQDSEEHWSMGATLRRCPILSQQRADLFSPRISSWRFSLLRWVSGSECSATESQSVTCPVFCFGAACFSPCRTHGQVVFSSQSHALFPRRNITKCFSASTRDSDMLNVVSWGILLPPSLEINNKKDVQAYLKIYWFNDDRL